MSYTSHIPVQTETGVPAPRAGEAPAAAVAAAAPVAPPADPGLIGLPAFIVGSIALALVDIHFAPAAAAGAAIPIIMTATSLGMLIATIWAARAGQMAVAAINGVFAGFWISYAALFLGLVHGWFGIGLLGIVRTQEVFLLSWIVVVGLLTLGTLRLPVGWTALLALVETAFVITYIATVNANVTLTKVAGWVVFAFAAIGAYAFMSSMSTATGGRPLPMGPPVLR